MEKTLQKKTRKGRKPKTKDKRLEQIDQIKDVVQLEQDQVRRGLNSILLLNH
jgi:hypothetical protein